MAAARRSSRSRTRRSGSGCRLLRAALGVVQADAMFKEQPHRLPLLPWVDRAHIPASGCRNPMPSQPRYTRSVRSSSPARTASRTDKAGHPGQVEVKKAGPASRPLQGIAAVGQAVLLGRARFRGRCSRTSTSSAHRNSLGSAAAGPAVSGTPSIRWPRQLTRVPLRWWLGREDVGENAG